MTTYPEEQIGKITRMEIQERNYTEEHKGREIHQGTYTEGYT